MNETRFSCKTTLRVTGSPMRFNGRLLTAGRVRDVLDQPGDIEIPERVLMQEAAQFENVACFVDHAGPFASPSLRDMFGVWSGVHYNPQTASIDGTLTVFDTLANREIAGILRQTLEAESAAPDIGVSIVFYGEWETGSASVRTLARFQKVESADLVFMPAADGRILEALSALSRHGGNSMSTQKEPAAVVSDAAAKSEITHAKSDILTPDFVEAQEQLGEEWLVTIKQSGLRQLLDDADLPQVVKKRLARGIYKSPQDVYEAIAEAHAELQALEQEETVQLGQRPYIHMREPQDEIRSHVEWFFGVEDAPLPPSNYRKLDQLYIAMTGDSEFHGVFRKDRVMLAAADTTTLAGMAVDAMNKVVMAQMSHLQFWRWYEKLAVPIPNDGSVQDMKLITFGGVGDLPTVAEGAAYTELTVDDTKETASFTKKGGYVGITLEMIRNSAIVEIQAVPRALAIAAVRTRSAAISNIFTSNSGVGPTLAQDSTALFHSNHSNVQTTALGTDATAWRAARVECFNHTEVNSSKKLAVFPKFLLVPDDLYDVALVITGYGEGMPTTYTPEAQARSAADPRPVVVVVPDWTDATDWAYMVDPKIYPVIQISYAQAPGGGVHPAPELYSVTDESQGLLFTNDVLPIKVRDWFAVNVNGPRGIGKRNVAG